MAQRKTENRRRGKAFLSVESLEDRTLLSVNLGANFNAMGFPDSGGWTPPDTIAAAGPNHVVECVNETIAFYDKSGHNLFQQGLAQFFGPVHGSAPFDPVVKYDELAGRFVVTALDVNFTSQTSHIDIAVSNDSNPMDGFTEMHALNDLQTSKMGQGLLWGDFDRLGYNADAYFVSVNMFSFSGNYDHPSVYAIKKSTVLDKNNRTFKTQKHDYLGSKHFTVVPAEMHGAVPGGPMYFVEESLPHYGTALRITTETNIFTGSLPVLVTNDVTVPTYFGFNAAPQPDGTFINNDDTRVESAAWVPTGGGRLLVAHTTGDASGVSHATWDDINTGTMTLNQGGTVNGLPNTYSFYPSINVNPAGDLGMTFMESSSTEFVTSWITGQKFGDPLNSMQTPAVLQASTNALNMFDGSPYRAGDYSGLTVDPNDGSFWAANEYATTASSNNWGTWIGNFTLTGGSGAQAALASAAGTLAQQSSHAYWFSAPGTLAHQSDKIDAFWLALLETYEL